MSLSGNIVEASPAMLISRDLYYLDLGLKIVSLKIEARRLKSLDPRRSV